MATDVLLNYHLKEAAKQADDAHLAGLLSRFAFSGDSVVLDCGCGVGQTLWLLGGRPIKIGVDIDHAALESGKNIAEEKDERIFFIKASIDRLPFSNGGYSHLICRVTLNYINQVKTLEEFARVLRPGGVLYLRVESSGFDISLIGRSRTAKELASRLYDFMTGFIYNVIGSQISPVKAGRMYCGRYRLVKSLYRLNFRLRHFNRVGSVLLMPKAIEIVAVKEA